MHIKLDFKILIFILFFFVTNQIRIYTALMWFALFHEMGHIICGILIGLKLEKIEIMPIRIFLSI